MNRLLHPLTILRRQRSRLQKYARRRRIRLDKTEISKTLNCFGPVEAPALMVHSSLSACGQIEGGVHTVVDALREWAGPATLTMPTHSYLYPGGQKQASYFDPRTSPSVVGAVTDFFWRQPGVVRSLHPSHSVACDGPLAARLCVDHEWAETPCGQGTPYEKLIELDCAVLMFGATLDAYTFFHTAEDAAAVPYLYHPEPIEVAYRGPLGLHWVMAIFRQDMGFSRRFVEMTDWLEKHELLIRRGLGLGELLYLPHAATVHRALVKELERDPWLLVKESARPISAVNS